MRLRLDPRDLLTAPAIGALIVLLLLGAFGWWSHARYDAGFKAGQAAQDAAYRKAYVKEAAKIRRRELEQVDLSAGLRETLGRQLGENAANYRQLRKEVPRHVTAKSDAGCVVPNGFVSLWNKGVSGPAGRTSAGVPPKPGGPVEGPSGLALSDVANAYLNSAEVAYDWRAEVDTWRKWYPAAKAKFEAE